MITMIGVRWYFPLVGDILYLLINNVGVFLVLVMLNYFPDFPPLELTNQEQFTTLI